MESKEEIQELIDQVNEIGKKFQGRKELLKHYMGKPLTQREAIKANCYSCMGYYDNGAEDCEIHMCPLHPFAPYSAKDPLKVKKSISKEAHAHLVELGAKRRKKKALDT
jgi:hypothetical protein